MGSHHGAATLPRRYTPSSTPQLQNRFPQVASLLDEAGPDVLAFSNFPVAEEDLVHLNKEIRRTDDLP